MGKLPWERCFGRATDGIRQERYISVNFKSVVSYGLGLFLSGDGILADRYFIRGRQTNSQVIVSGVPSRREKK